MRLFRLFRKRKDYIFQNVGPRLKEFNRAADLDEKYNQQFRIF